MTRDFWKGFCLGVAAPFVLWLGAALFGYFFLKQ